MAQVAAGDAHRIAEDMGALHGCADLAEAFGEFLAAITPAATWA
jgi:hypothetical protein